MRQKRLHLCLLALAPSALRIVGLGLRLAEAIICRFVARQAATGPFTSGVSLERNVLVPMRDGVRLATDLYRPTGPGPFPVILIRLPYGKSGIGGLLASFFARYGYLVAAQDTRGRYDSEGEFYPWACEQADGHDTVRWLAAQPWCNGKIGTLGASYFGYTQWALAPGNPQVTALLPIFTASSIYNAFYAGGAFLKMAALGWSLENCGRRYAAVGARKLWKGYEHLPLITSDDAALHNIPFFDDWVSHPTPDDYWAAIDVTAKIPTISAPVFLVSGWYDLFNVPQLDDWAEIQKRAKAPVRELSKIIIGPWNHSFVNPHQRNYGLRAPLWQYPLEPVGDWKRWFDYVLKGEPNGWGEQAPVRLYVLGENRWRDEQEWPLARTVYTRYYLHSAGRANTARGDGWLDACPPTDSEPADSFVYDPLRPVPTVGGANLDPRHAGPADQRRVEAREDVLVYSTSPLTQATEVTGPVVLTLFASSDAPDTDFTAKLVDVFPDGRALLLCDGIIRARYRNGLDRPELLQAGAVYRFTIRLGNTSVLFGAGHRIRLEVSSSNFPRFDRNPNTGTDVAREGQTRVARQRVWHDAERPSYLALPIIPR